jgi:hypothetical protein
MSIHLDHLMVPSRNKLAGAKLLAELLGVPWSPTGVGPFAPVFVNDGLTLDFDQWAEPIPPIHYCFRVDERDFDAILARLQAAGIAYRSSVHGPLDYEIDTRHGGRIVYWSHYADFSVGCYCENEARCHRSLLRELLIEKGAAVQKTEDRRKTE